MSEFYPELKLPVGNETPKAALPEVAAPDFAALDAAVAESQARAFAAVDAQTTAPAEIVSALHMTLEEFVATLPPRIQQQTIQHQHLFSRAQKNARIARNLETRAAELGKLFGQIKEQGFTVADLVAFENQWRGAPAFGYNSPDYVLPVGYRRADREDES